MFIAKGWHTNSNEPVNSAGSSSSTGNTGSTGSTGSTFKLASPTDRALAPAVKWSRLATLQSPATIPEDVSLLLGQSVKLAGYMVPLNGDEEGFSKFLLVPSPGQCRHVPPPPPNNTIFCHSQKRIAYSDDPVWVTGRLTIELTQSHMAPAFYSFAVNTTTPFEEGDQY